MSLGDLCMEQQEYPRSAGIVSGCVAEQPPRPRSARSKVGTAHLFNARLLAESQRFDKARAEYQACLSFKDVGQEESSTFCKWAACEFKAGNSTRAEELLQQALAQADNRLAVAYSMLIEIIRLKLPRELKARFDKDFKELLAEPPTAAAAAAAATIAAVHIKAGVKYSGQKQHEKQVLAYLDKAARLELAESQLEQICSALHTLKRQRLLRKLIGLGQVRFPNNPSFYLIEAEDQIGTWTIPLQYPGEFAFYWRKLATCSTKCRRMRNRNGCRHKFSGQLQALEFLNPLLAEGPMAMFEDMIDGMGEDDDDWE